MGLLQDKVCVITGGAGSIGLASAKLFLAEGARVMLVDLHDRDLARVLAGLDRDRTASVAADVSVADLGDGAKSLQLLQKLGLL